MADRLKVRLTNYDRQRIHKKIMNHAFGERWREAHREEGALFLRVIEHTLSAEDRDLLTKIPDKWLVQTTWLNVRANGWNVQLQFWKDDERCDFHGPVFLRNSKCVIVGDLGQEIQAASQRWEKLREENGSLHRELESLLAGCKTFAQVIERLPEMKDIISEILPEERQRTEIVPVAASIMCKIAKARGEEREGCCDGAIVPSEKESEEEQEAI